MSVIVLRPASLSLEEVSERVEQASISAVLQVQAATYLRDRLANASDDDGCVACTEIAKQEVSDVV